jgi:flagellar protein FliS
MRTQNRSSGNPLGRYARVGLETDVASASPHRLIEMLLDGALAKIATASGHMGRGEIAEKGANISWAISIIDGLRGSLDFERGGEIAANLNSIYEYTMRRLVEANLKNDTQLLDEAYRLIADIRAGWVGIKDQVAQGDANNSTGPISHQVG